MTPTERQFDAAQRVIDWEHRLRTSPNLGFEAESFAQLLEEIGHPLPITDCNDEGVKKPKAQKDEEVQMMFNAMFPALRLVIQDNFLLVDLILTSKADPAFGSDLSFENGRFRDLTRPRVDHAHYGRPEAILICLYCQTPFLLQANGHIHNFTRHYFSFHWEILQQRMQQIERAQFSEDGSAPLSTVPPGGLQRVISFPVIPRGNTN